MKVCDYQGYDIWLIAAKCNSPVYFLPAEKDFSVKSVTGDTLFYWVIRNQLEPDPISLLKNISSGDKIIEESIKCAELYNDYKTMKYLEDLRLKPENNN